MKKQKHLLSIAFLFLFFFCLTLCIPEAVQAADTPVSITYCKVSSNGKKVTVKAKVKQKNSSYGKKLYLLAVDSQTSEKKAVKATPLASKTNKKGNLSFKVKYKENMLFQKFAIAYKTKGKYKIVSNTFYITNPEVFATYKGSGPKTSSKKGLQPEDLDEALELRTQHAVINWTVNSLLTTNCTNTVPYQYRGKTYYFNADMLDYNDAQVKAYNKAGTRVSIILLLPNSSNSETDAMRYKGSSYAKYSSFNISSQKGCRTFEALMSYLAKRYGTKENYVAGWILGNEVNNPYEWNYGGNKSLTSYMEQYSRAFHICYNAVRSVSKKSNVYISLDYNWNCDPDNSGKRYFTTKATLDEFYHQVNLRGKVPFHIAYHAYPQGLIDPVFWDDSLATNSTASTFITFRNLNVLTNYVKKNFGKNYTIMLSEQSFNSTKGEAVQAAAYAYAYYLSECNSMIESFIYSRHFDNPIEMAQGCYWGLCDQSHNKRMIWHVFQNIDSSSSFKFTNQLVKYTNLSSWSKIKGFKKSKFTKMETISRKPTLGNVKMEDTNTVILFWNRVHYVDGYEIYRNDQKIDTIMDPTVTGYIDKNVPSGETCTYKIRSFKFIPGTKDANQKGALFSSYSNTQSITVSTGKATWNADKCKVNGKNIALGWISQKSVAGYEIERSDSENGSYSVIADTTKTSYTDKNTVPGMTYFYRVRAYVKKNDTKYYGDYSDILDMQANIQLAAKIVDGKLTLSWSAFPNALKYQIYCSSDSDESFVKIKTTGNGTDTTYTTGSYKISGETCYFAMGETYHFKVRAMLPDNKRSSYSNVADLLIDQELVVEDTGSTQEATESTEAVMIEETETEGTEDTSETAETETGATETETETAATETEGTENQTETSSSETAETETEGTEDQPETAETETEATETETQTDETEDETGATETEPQTDETEKGTRMMETETNSTGAGHSSMEMKDTKIGI